MALRDWIDSDPDGTLQNERVRLRAPQAADFAEWAALRAESRDFLQPWEPTWASDALTRAGWKRRLEVYERDIAADLTYPFLIFRMEDGALVGGLTLSNVRRGVAQACSMGYWIGLPFARRGYVSSAVDLAKGHVFGALGLHRIEAACVPENAASRNLLLKSGFTLEGKARAYLKINGVWRDHLLFGLVESEA